MTQRLATLSDTTDQNTDRHVLIAGGGIGGLTLALAFANKNISSHIFERRDTFTPEGAGIQVGPNGARILISLGLEAAINAVAGYPQAVVPRDGLTGEKLAQMPVGLGHNPDHTAPYWTLHRADLHAALLAAVHDNPLVSLTVGAEVLRADETPDGVQIVLANHDKHDGDAFVAADGCHSRFRKTWGSDQPLIATGKGAVRTVIAAPDCPTAINKQTVGVWFTPGAHVVHYPVHSGREIALVAIFDDDDNRQDWTTPVSNDWVRARATSLHGDLKALLNTGTDWKKWSLATAPPLKTWSSGRKTLLGDAAHPILPFLAQGAVMAMEDAVVLADMLSNGLDDVPGALQRYQRLRLPRTKRIAKASRRNGLIYHQAGLSAALRNRTMRLLGGQTLINQYNWVYDWQPPA